MACQQSRSKQAICRAGIFSRAALRLSVQSGDSQGNESCFFRCHKNRHLWRQIVGEPSITSRPSSA